MPDIYQGNPPLETDRLLLRKLTLSDAPSIFAYASNEDTTQFMLWNTHRSLADSEAFIAWTLQRYQNGEAGEWGIELKETGRLIGTIGFTSCNPGQRRAELGYILAPQYWGRGLMPEAAARVVEFAFDNMDMNRIESCHFLSNEKSGRVMQKIGMVCEGTALQRLFAKGRFWDARQYALLKEDWVRRRSQSNDGYTISGDKALINIARVCEMLGKSYWANARPRETVERSILNSLCWGVYQDGEQVGFARIVTDQATIYWLCDVIIDERHRGRGLGKRLVEAVVTSSALAPLRGILGTSDAHSLYEQFGFRRVGDRFMVRMPG
jgi:ribosomal-protein-alanine N-acetyltransferase